MRGWKVTNPDSSCRGFLFEVGKTYKHEGKIGLCEAGFHFCKMVCDCFNYYSFDPKNLVYEIEAIGKIIEGADKCVTDEIKIIRLVPWAEMLEYANTGKGNTGRGNSGDWNSGDWNSGYRNSGYRNSGDWNAGNYWSGCFNTDECQDIHMFNKHSGWSHEKWCFSTAYGVMRKLEPLEFVFSENMTEEEKKSNPIHEALGGFLRKNDLNSAWDDLSDEERGSVLSLPNFDAKIFKVCTGIDVEAGK